MKNARRTIGTVVALVATVTVVVGALLLVNADSGLAGCTMVSGFGWMAPLLLGSVLGGATWALLAQRRSDQQSRGGYEAVPCTTCGREVLGQWRMCPYCGAMLVRDSGHEPAGDA